MKFNYRLYNIDEKHLSESILETDQNDTVAANDTVSMNDTLLNNVLIERILCEKNQYVIDATSFCIVALDDQVATTNILAIFGGSHGLMYFQNQFTSFKIAAPKILGNLKNLYNLDHFMYVVIALFIFILMK